MACSFIQWRYTYRHRKQNINQSCTIIGDRLGPRSPYALSLPIFPIFPNGCKRRPLCQHRYTPCVFRVHAEASGPRHYPRRPYSIFPFLHSLGREKERSTGTRAARQLASEASEQGHICRPMRIRAISRYENNPPDLICTVRENTKTSPATVPSQFPIVSQPLTQHPCDKLLKPR